MRDSGRGAGVSRSVDPNVDGVSVEAENSRFGSNKRDTGRDTGRDGEASAVPCPSTGVPVSQGDPRVHLHGSEMRVVKSSNGLSTLKAAPHQVAGHLFERGKAGSLIDDVGHFYKPLQPGPRGEREETFYRYVSGRKRAEREQLLADFERGGERGGAQHALQSLQSMQSLQSSQTVV